MVATSGRGWRLAPSLIALFDQANLRAPNRNRASDGSVGDASHSNRTSDHNPSPAGWVCAGDITHDPAGGLDAHALAELIRARRDPRVKYVISNGRMFASYPKPHRPAWAWGTYTGVNAHRAHAHISVLETTQGLTDTRPWFSSAPTPAQEAPAVSLTTDQATQLKDVQNKVDQMWRWLTDTTAPANNTYGRILRSLAELDNEHVPALLAAVGATDPDEDLSRAGSGARVGVRDVIGLALTEDFGLSDRLDAIESALADISERLPDTPPPTDPAAR